ncbi:MAG: signal peptidase I [Caulobacterales bacterium]
MSTAAKAAKADKPRTFLQELVEVVTTVVYALLIALVLRVVLFQPYTIPSASEEPNLYRGDYIIVSKWSYGWSQKSVPFADLYNPIFHGRLLFTPPRRGDVIVFKLPRDGHTDYIKRLVGLPGDRIQVISGQLYINGKAVKETVDGTPTPPRGIEEPDSVRKVIETNPEGRRYVTQVYAPTEDRPGDNTGVYVVPPHCYFMMGDNRDNSDDSRFDPGLTPDDPKLGGCAWDANLDKLAGGGFGVGFVPEDNLVGKAQVVLLSWNTGPLEEQPAGASIFKPWTWITEARPGRFFKLVK